MKRFHTLRIRAGWWVDNGGGATLISCGQKEGEVVDVNVVPEQHLRWLEELPLMHIDKHRVYVHAGVEPDQPLDAQQRRHSGSRFWL